MILRCTIGYWQWRISYIEISVIEFVRMFMLYAYEIFIGSIRERFDRSQISAAIFPVVSLPRRDYTRIEKTQGLW